MKIDTTTNLTKAMFEYIIEHTEKEVFTKALQEHDIGVLRVLPKSDLHIHSTRGCSRKIFEEMYRVKFPDVPRFNSLKEMDDWYNTYIDHYAKDYFGFDIRMKAMLNGFERESVTVASPIYCLKMSKYFKYDYQSYINYLKKDILLFAPHTEILPEFEITRGEDPDKVLDDLEKVIPYDFYKSIDIKGDENLGTKQYEKVYKKAKELGLVLKAHIGEFGGIEKIDEALEYLNLDCITHAIKLTESKDMMNYVRDKEIMINCCPSSNYHLSRVDSYTNHPIKEFVRNGIICSINTDDELIFNQSINDEYLNLYESGCLTADELYEVKENGLKKCLNKRR